MSRNAVIIGSVLALHVAGLWALQSGLVRKAAEIIVPAQLLSEFIAPPTPKVTPPPPAPPAPQPPKPAPRAKAPDIATMMMALLRVVITGVSLSQGQRDGLPRLDSVDSEATASSALRARP